MALKSFIEVAPDSHFPLENLPFGVFKPREGSARVGVALGEYVVDLAALEAAGLFRDLPPESPSRTGIAAATTRDSLNEFLALGRPVWRKVREILQKLLSAETPTLRDDKDLRDHVFHRQRDVSMQLHRFLFVLSSRAQCRHDVARSGERADAQLEMVAGGVSRPRQFCCRQRD
jgi:fumarylacetoacetase